MTSCVYFKMFHNRQGSDVETVNFTGSEIKLLDLKRAIVDIKKFSQGMDFDLTILDANNLSKVYSDESSFVPKNTTVVVKRRPVSSGEIGLLARRRGVVSSSQAAAQKEQGIVIPKKAPLVSEAKSPQKVVANEEFTNGTIGSSSDKSQLLQASSEVEPDEEMAMLQSLSQKKIPKMSGTNKVWTADGKYDIGQSSVKPSHPASRKPNVPPPPEYVCVRCGKKGHYVAHCPTNNDHSYDRPKGGFVPNGYGVDGKPEKAVGVPQPSQSSVTVKDLTGVDTEGKIVVQVKDGYEIRAPATKQFESLVSRGGAKSTLADLDLSAVPAPLKCPLSGKLLRDAVSTPCCRRVVSGDDYREVLFRTEELRCPLCKEEVVPDDLRPHKETKNKVEDFLLKVLGPNIDAEPVSDKEKEMDKEIGKENTLPTSAPPPPPPPPPGPPPLAVNSPPPIPSSTPPQMNMSGPPVMNMAVPPSMQGPVMHMNAPLNMSAPHMHGIHGSGPGLGGLGTHGGGNFLAHRHELQSIMNLFDNGPFPKVWDLEPMTIEEFKREQGFQRAYFEEQAAKKRLGERRQREPFVPNKHSSSNMRGGDNRWESDRRTDSDHRGGRPFRESRRYGYGRHERSDDYDRRDSEERHHSRTSSPASGKDRGHRRHSRDGRDHSEDRSIDARSHRRGDDDSFGRGRGRERERTHNYDRDRDSGHGRDRDRHEKNSHSHSRSRSKDRRHHERGRREGESSKKRSKSVEHADDASQHRDRDRERESDRHSGRRSRHHDSDHDRGKRRQKDDREQSKSHHSEEHNDEKDLSSKSKKRTKSGEVAPHDDRQSADRSKERHSDFHESKKIDKTVKHDRSRHRSDEGDDEAKTRSSRKNGGERRTKDRDKDHKVKGDDSSNGHSSKEDRERKHKKPRRSVDEKEGASRKPKLGRTVSETSAAADGDSLHHRRRGRR